MNDFRETVWLNAYCTALALDHHESACALTARQCLEAFDKQFRKVLTDDLPTR